MSIFEQRLRRWQNQESSKIEGKVSERVKFVVARCYLYGRLDKPLEEVTDKEFLDCYEVGPTTLAEIRKVIPEPEK